MEKTQTPEFIPKNLYPTLSDYYFWPMFTTMPFENQTIIKQHHMAILLQNSLIVQLLGFW